MNIEKVYKSWSTRKIEAYETEVLNQATLSHIMNSEDKQMSINKRDWGLWERTDQADMTISSSMLRSAIHWIWIWQFHQVYHFFAHPKPSSFVRQFVIWSSFVDTHAWKCIDIRTRLWGLLSFRVCPEFLKIDHPDHVIWLPSSCIEINLTYELFSSLVQNKYFYKFEAEEAVQLSSVLTAFVNNSCLSLTF